MSCLPDRLLWPTVACEQAADEAHGERLHRRHVGVGAHAGNQHERSRTDTGARGIDDAEPVAHASRASQAIRAGQEVSAFARGQVLALTLRNTHNSCY